MRRVLKTIMIYVLFLAGGLVLGHLAQKLIQDYKNGAVEINRADYFNELNEKVRLYGTESCEFCKKTREYLQKNHITYTDIDIEKTPIGKVQYEKLGGGGVPIVLIGNQKIQGYAPDLFDAALKKFK